MALIKIKWLKWSNFAADSLKETQRHLLVLQSAAVLDAAVVGTQAAVQLGNLLRHFQHPSASVVMHSIWPSWPGAPQHSCLLLLLMLLLQVLLLEWLDSITHSLFLTSMSKREGTWVEEKENLGSGSPSFSANGDEGLYHRWNDGEKKFWSKGTWRWLLYLLIGR